MLMERLDTARSGWDRNSTKTAGRVAFLIAVFLFWFLGPSIQSVHGQQTQIQTYLRTIGDATFTTPLPVEYGAVNAANGNLHLEIPLGSFPQRGGHTYSMVLMYDSDIWTPVTDPNSGSSVWQPVNVPNASNSGNSWSGWRLVTSGDSGGVTFGAFTSVSQVDGSPCGPVYGNFIWTEANGTQHSFPVEGNPNPSCYAVYGTSGYDNDGTGYYMTLVDGINAATVYAPDGSRVFPTFEDTNGNYFVNQGNLQYQTTYTPPSDPCSGFDSYGNFVWTAPDGARHLFPIATTTGGSCGSDTPTGTATDGSGYTMSVTNYTTAVVSAPGGAQVYPLSNFRDMLGRTPVSTTVSGNTVTYAVLNSQGTQSTYTVTLTSFPVCTHFADGFDIDYCNGQPNLTAIQSIKFPDNRTYSFTYDSGYGLLATMKLPSGSTISHGYSNFRDALGGVSRWVTSRTTPDSAVAWTYTPQVISTCGANQVNCQQKVTVQKPDGDTTVYTFTLNGGAWDSQVQTYSGGASSANLLSTTTVCWNFVTTTNAQCTYSVTTGAAATSVQKYAVSLTVPTPTAALSKTTEYFYDSNGYGNLVQVSEWQYYTGTLPAKPDRTTCVSYLGGSPYATKNILNRPATVTVVDNWSSTPCNAPPLTHTITKTQYNYDGSSLTSLPGAKNHDDTNFGTSNTARGNDTQIQVWDGSTWWAKTMAYDTTGQVTQVADYAGNKTSYSYNDSFYTDNGTNAPPSSPGQSTNAYVTQATLPLIGTVKWGYYYGTGQLAMTQDANGQPTHYSYHEAMSRPTAVYYPIGWSLSDWSTPGQIDTYTGVGDLSPSTGCSSCAHKRFVFDPLERKQSEIVLNNPGGASNMVYSYDTNGRLSSITRPYVNGNPVVRDSYSYDGMDRVVALAHFDSSNVTAMYGSKVINSGNSVELTPLCAQGTYGYGYPKVEIDEAGKIKEQWVDAFGRIIEADENDPHDGVVPTCYAYDLQNNLTKVVQGAQTRTFQYDALGRLTSETTPEAGQVTLAYVVGGNLCSGDVSNVCSRTDARGVVTNYLYDTLGRLVGKNYTIPPNSNVSAMLNVCTPTGLTQQQNVCLYYDQGGASTNAMSRLTKMVDPSGSETYTYDISGRMSQKQKVIGGKTYTTTFQYNVADQPTQIVYPSGRVVQMSYNPIGQLCAVAGQVSQTSQCSATTSPYATGHTYDAAGQVTGFGYGNGVTASYSYSVVRPEIASVSYTNGTQTLFSLSYWYANDPAKCTSGQPGYMNNGKIQCITDNMDSGRSISFTYDSLNRLSQASTAGSANYPQWGLKWNYDRYGNRWAQTQTLGSPPSSSLSFGSSGMDSSTNNRPNGFTYDASGNLTIEPLTPSNNNYTYDAENRLTNFQSGSGAAAYTYDGSGKRVQKSLQNGTTTVYVFAGEVDIAEYDNGALPNAPSREYIYNGGHLLATMTATANGITTTYHHSDHLSVRLSTNGTAGSPTYGQKIGEEGHFPYGEVWYLANATTKRFFTSYERDSETGLDYALARYYNGRIGSFCSADPVEGSADDPQTWNRYLYVRDDPVNITDPSGKFLEWLIGLILGILSAIGHAIVVVFQAIFLNAPTWEVTNELTTSTLAGATTGAGEFTIQGVYTAYSIAGNVAVIAAQAGVAGAAGVTTFASAETAFNTASQDLQNKKLNKKNCKKDFASLSKASGQTVTPDSIHQGAANANFLDGVGSTIPRQSLYATSPVAGVRQAGLGISGTVGDQIASNPGVVASSQLGGHDIYLNAARIDPKDYWNNMSTVLHEVVHNVSGLTDSDIQRALGLKEQDISDNISKKLKSDCL